MPDSGKWLSANDAPLPSEDPTSTPFQITAPPKTDIWRRSDEDDVFTAPILYQKLPASDFQSVSVTVFAPWKTQYDQGGLLVAFPATGSQPTKWIKAGIEYHDRACVLGVVGTDRYSDWSLSPMGTDFHQKARFTAARDGATLWIHAAQEGAEKMLPMREVKWAFLEGRLEQEVWVGVYAAKPTPEEDDEEKGIEVSFSDLVLERREE